VQFWCILSYIRLLKQSKNFLGDWGGGPAPPSKYAPGWNKLSQNWEGDKFRARKFLQLPPTIPVCPRPLIGGTCPFCPPVEAMHAVTVMSRKAIGLRVSVGTVLTSRQIRLFSPNFSRTTESEAIEKWEGKTITEWITPSNARTYTVL